MMSSGKNQALPIGDNIVLCGHLRKSGSLISGLKPLKKKFFVLRGDAPGQCACLEYYDSKKKFDNKNPPKRCITIRSCYNINRRIDTRHKYVIALYTKDDCFSLILDNEKELDEWLTSMWYLSGDVPDGEEPRPTFEHVWQVTLQKKGLGERQNLSGPWRLCLTDRILSLIKVGAEDSSDCLEFPLTTIRRCGCMDRIFYMEVGRSAVTGEGDYWMKAEDNNIAHNMHAAIMNAMSSSSKDKDDIFPHTRKRSSSANEASKPISFIPRRQTGSKLHGFSPLEEQKDSQDQVDLLQEQNVTASAPSQSCSQSQSSSSGNTLTAVAGTGSLGAYAIATANRRRHSVATQPITNDNSQLNVTTLTTSTINVTNAAPTSINNINNNNNNNNTTTMITTVATKSHQRTLSLPLAAVAINHTQSSKRPVLRCTTVRDRCDSLPSRARTSSEGGHPTPLVLAHTRSAHLAPHSNRPHSIHGRGLSYSPPVSSMPISPASCTCSTDSAGSSLSMDDNADNMIEETAIARYGHSLTPDEPVILEENMDDYAPWSSGHSTQKFSPNFKSHSPSQQSSYVDMCSPSGSSPGRIGVYMPMSPGTGHNHSRGSSLVEEMTLPDGYVPMAPVGDSGYVDMDRSNLHNGHFPDDLSQHGSSCSVTSGTPSTDSRFMGYALDKVSSFLPPSDDIRPTRAYSVGSRPETSSRHRKNRLDIALQEANRVRAFSVGSRSKRPELGRLSNIVTSRLPTSVENVNPNKSNSAPLLSSSWGHNSVNSDRMEDLMEMDFSRTAVQSTLPSPQSSDSQSQSISTATDTSSYVDMSPGQPHVSIIDPYVDMSGINKAHRNNNNNSSTANHNHNHVHITGGVSSIINKPLLKTLMPVVESEGSYMQMDNSLEEWSRIDTIPKKPPSPMQEDYMLMNGPPGVTRTAPVDLPQPRKPPEGYVEMTFNPRSNSEKEYINMAKVSVRAHRRNHSSDCKEKSQRSQPIAIQASSKPTKTPSFLPLSTDSTSESLESTPVSPPVTTPTGSNATIFPFSLNSPQSPIKEFVIEEKSGPSSSDYSSEVGDYAVMTPGKDSLSLLSSPVTINPSIEGNNERPESPIKQPIKTIANSTVQQQQQQISTQIQLTSDSSLSPLTKKLIDLNITKKKLQEFARNTINPITNSSINNNPVKDDSSVVLKITNDSKILKNDKPPSPTGRDSTKGSQELPQSPVTKKLTDMSVSKVKLIGSSPNISPTPVGGTKIAPTKISSPKIPDDTTATTTTTTTVTATSTPPPSLNDSEGYEKLQPGASLLHYASLDLPESSSVPPVSPTPVQEGFRYAEIDFAKLKQN